MPPAVERLAKKYLRRPAIVTIGVAGQAVDTVEQRVEMINSEEKKKCVLFRFMSLDTSDRLIVRIECAQVEVDRDLEQWRIRTSHDCLRESKERSRRSTERLATSSRTPLFLSSLSKLLLTPLTLE